MGQKASRGWGCRRPALAARLRPPKYRRLTPRAPSSPPPTPPGPRRWAGAAAGGPRLRAARVPTHLRFFPGPQLGVGGFALGVWPRSEPVSSSALTGGPGPRTASSPEREGATIRLRPQIRRDNPLNLSILLSGGKETNQDSLSSGERRGKSPAPNPRPTGGRGKCGVWKTACPVSLGGLSPSDRGSARGRCEAGNGPRRAGVRSSRSRVVWECSPKRVVNSI